MKKLAALVFTAVFALSIVFLSGPSASVHANSLGTASQVVPKTKHISQNVYHHGRRYTRKTWHKSKHISHKVVRKTKHIVVGKPRRRRP